MYLMMAGVDFHTATAELRARFAFTKTGAGEFLNYVTGNSGVIGAVLISTCNRTELYISVDEKNETDPREMLGLQCVNDGECECIYSFENEKAVSHLMEVACGLHSQILHEEQIVTQVNQAIGLARELKTADPVLDTLFRIAVSAGKYALSNVSTPGVSLSLSYEAVRRLEHETGSLLGKRCLIIGNGKMGRLAAELLVKKGCEVYVTLRSYRHGENKVPPGTVPIKYEDRARMTDGADIVISATRSPHCTVTFDMISKIKNRPKWIIDLAMPCDVETKCGEIDGVELWNLDTFNSGYENDSITEDELKAISCKYAADFWEWANYREALPYIEKLKSIMSKRIIESTVMDGYRESEHSTEIVNITTQRIIDMLMGSLKPAIEPDLIERCLDKIADRAHIS